MARTGDYKVPLMTKGLAAAVAAAAQT